MIRIHDETVLLPQGRIALRRLRPEPVPAESAPWLVFLHEGLGSIRQWKTFPEDLVQATGLNGLVYERYGYGGSDPSNTPRDARYLHTEAQEMLPRLLDALGLERVVTVGHSDGGSIALLHAAAEPGRVAALATAAAHVFVEEQTLAGIRRALVTWETTDLRQRLARYHGEGADSVFHAWTDTWLAPWFRDWNIEADIQGVKAPALIIQGQDDEYGSADQVRAIAAAVAGPVTTLMPDDCGHSPHLQAPEMVLPALEGFIRTAVAGP